MIHLTAILLVVISGIAAAQDNGFGDSRAATGGARPPQMNEGFLGRDVPAFDPGSEVATFDGKIWNINNNRLFRARFEKYLNAPPATSKADMDYRKTIDRILNLLAPGKATKQNIDEAFALLPKASEYKDDANLCRTMADAIHAARTSQQTIERLKRENATLEKQRVSAEWNNQMATKSSPLNIPGSARSSSDMVKAYQEDQKLERDTRLATTRRILSEITQTIENNKVRMALTELSAKGHLQALIMQYFATRRFEHVIIANRFYRAIYSDGDNSIDVYKQMVEGLPVNKDAGQATIRAELDPRVAASAGTMDQDAASGAGAGGGDKGTTVNVYNSAPRNRTGTSFAASGAKFGLDNFGIESVTGGVAVAAQTISKLVSSLSQIDSLANEAIRDVNEGVEAYKFLLEQGELNSASERLAETFALGEFMPNVRLLPREDKRRALQFTQLNNELLAALEVNDLTRAEKLVNEIGAIAGDYNTSKPLAKIETAKTLSAMHLAKAKNAAISGDRAVMESELRAAAEIWPRNPALAEVGNTIFKQTDVQLQAINELESLIDQGDHRTIFNQSAKFIAAAALYPDKQEKLGTILKEMTQIEASLQRAREYQQRGDAAGAWESIQLASQQYPQDTEINKLRADLASGGAATFVQSLNKGTDLESRGEYGAALAWYLDAHRQYPPSKFAQERIDALAARILPGATPASTAP
jgi:hypothetical protein